MPFGARFAWLVGRNARIGRFVGGRTIDDFEMERRAPVPAVARADPTRFRAEGRRIFCPATAWPGPADAVRSRRRRPPQIPGPDQDPPGAIVVVGGFAHTQSRA